MSHNDENVPDEPMDVSSDDSASGNQNIVNDNAMPDPQPLNQDDVIVIRDSGARPPAIEVPRPINGGRLPNFRQAFRMRRHSDLGGCRRNCNLDRLPILSNINKFRLRRNSGRTTQWARQELLQNHTQSATQDELYLIRRLERTSICNTVPPPPVNSPIEQGSSPAPVVNPLLLNQSPSGEPVVPPREVPDQASDISDRIRSISLTTSAVRSEESVADLARSVSRLRPLCVAQENVPNQDATSSNEPSTSSASLHMDLGPRVSSTEQDSSVRFSTDEMQNEVLVEGMVDEASGTSHSAQGNNPEESDSDDSVFPKHRRRKFSSGPSANPHKKRK